MQLLPCLEALVREGPAPVMEKALWCLGNFARCQRYKAHVLKASTVDMAVRLIQRPGRGTVLRYTALKFFAFAFEGLQDALAGEILTRRSAALGEDTTLLQCIEAGLHA